MERKLFVIRHGKSSWEHLVDDIDRPLIERGIKGAYLVAERLLKAGLVPERAISSPAVRALHTAEIVTRTLGMEVGSLEIRKELYLADLKDILKLIAGTDDRLASLAIFGHNPGFTDLANFLMKDRIDNLPTAGVLVVTFRAERWKDLDRQKVSEVYFDFPKNQQ